MINLRLRRLDINTIQVETSLVHRPYIVSFFADEVLVVNHPGLRETFSLDDFEDDYEEMAIAAYVVATIEMRTIGD